VYRILSLDGGGMRGLITVTLLRRLEAAVPGWLELVDLVTGSSTGRLLAIALANGDRLEELATLYTTGGRRIFARSRRERWLALRGILRAGYDNGQLEAELRRRLGDLRLSDLPRRLLVPAFALDSGNGHSGGGPGRNGQGAGGGRSWGPRFFHNFDASGDAPAYKVALYTSAAPGYFPAVDGYVDGGVCAYHPGAAALTWVGAGRAAGGPAASLAGTALLSLGTGAVDHYLDGARYDWSLARWLPSMLRLLRDGNIGLAEQQCQLLLDERYHRLSPRLPRTFSSDNWAACGELEQVGEEADISATVAWLQAHWQGDKRA
jgi:uncharacterized protein